MKKSILLVLLAITTMFAGSVAFAQVTTSSLGGRVYDSTGDVAGAVVLAVHTPSGTTYHTVTDRSGNYRIHNMRVGGPYRVEIEMLGYGKSVTDGIILKLGETYVHDVRLVEESLSLEGVVVTADVGNPILNSEKAGASSNFTSRDLANLPTGTRSISDVLKLTPQSNGLSFGGRDNRMNNFMVDGSGFNNNFGLNADMPGGGNPVSYEAIEEIQVNLSPYDVRQSRFTGAAINAVTKSGTNDWDGSVYTYQMFKGMHGDKVADKTVNGAKDLTSQTYGFSVGGPIVKDKLFFFVNAEYAPSSAQGPAYRPSTDGVANKAEGIARTTVEDLQKVKDYLLDPSKGWTYDPGTFGEGGWANFNNYGYKIMARIDWNINNDHHLMFRFNDVVNSVWNTPNPTSGPSGLARATAGRSSDQSVPFSNNFYTMNNNVLSFAAELSSRFSDVVSNQFLATVNLISDRRGSPSAKFPQVDIWKDGNAYMSLGYELFTWGNTVDNNTVDITDNITFNLGNHTLTAGASFEYMFVNNIYTREGTSYYRYASVDDFLQDKAPIGMGLTYGYYGGNVPGQQMHYSQASAYIQDEWEITRKFRLTYGVRFEMPFYLDKMETNNKILQVAQEGKYPGGAWDTGTWPKSRISINPRVGFNWDVLGDRSLQVRGGTGLFTGVNPFVWFTNQVGGSGMVQSPELSFDATAVAANFPDLKFTPDYLDLLKKYPTVFPDAPNANSLPTPANLAMVDKNFHFPMVWRSNLAFDVKLPWDMVFTGEALYTKDIYSVFQVNANQKDPSTTLAGADNRPLWAAGNKINNDVSSAMLFTNTRKGYAAQFTAQLTKNFSNGLSGMVAYTYSDVKDVTANPGSTAYSVWTANTAVGSLNDEVLSYSNFSIPHRVVASLSYKISYARNFASTFSIFYQGAHNGRISYTYADDLNGDGAKADLLYVPKDASEIKFADIYVSGGKVKYGDFPGGEGDVLLANAADQSTAFFEYVDGNKYLSSHKGQYVERFGDLQKWVNRIDFKFAQDIYSNFGTKNRFGLQLTLDILNVANLINPAWGNYYTASALSYQNLNLLKVVNNGGGTTAPTFALNTNATAKTAANGGVDAFKSYTKWDRALAAGNCWSMIFGVRLTF